MIDTVANTLAQKLECQEFLSTVAGVARAQKLNVDGKIKTLPAFPNPEKKNGYVWLTPQQPKQAFHILKCWKTKRQMKCPAVGASSIPHGFA